MCFFGWGFEKRAVCLILIRLFPQFTQPSIISNYRFTQAANRFFIQKAIQVN
jgi:hypothetical protein